MKDWRLEVFRVLFKFGVCVGEVVWVLEVFLEFNIERKKNRKMLVIED